MANVMSRRLSRLGYTEARRLLLAVGLVVLAVVALVAYARRVDPVEVAATLLFMPIFVAFLFKGVLGGLVAAVVAIVAYATLRYPAIEAVGVEQYTGLLASRAAAYLIFGAVGGWATQVLESALAKLDLYDEIDDETGLYNARHLLVQTDLEVARARRYKTLFSVVSLDLPAQPFDDLARRRRHQVLRDLGRQVSQSVRAVDHVVHYRDGDVHRLAAILPETGEQGAEVFRGRFADGVQAALTERGVGIDEGAVASTCITVPGDEPALDALRADAGRVERSEHRAPRPA